MDSPFANSPEVLQQLTLQAKQALRRKLRALRAAIPAARADQRSQVIVERLQSLPWVQSARRVALFAPLLERREVDLRPLDTWLRQRGCALYYPFMEPAGDGLRTGFRLVDNFGELEERGRRFPEPPSAAAEAGAGELDLVLVPALGVTLGGQRLGYGSGFYDATLREFCPPARSVVVAYDFQLLAELPTEPHDFGCDAVITDRGGPLAASHHPG